MEIDDISWDHLLELIRSMQSDLLPSLVRMHEDDDLSLLDGTMLRLLDRGEDPTVRELAALIGRSDSRTSRIVDRLVRRGLVAREEDERDRRVRRVRLTGRGEALLQRIDRLRVETQAELWRHVTDDDRIVLIQAMEIYAKAARRIRDERDRSG
ncbi:MarR family winged helix-turn-helix transcriptional regulator [Nonomuraea zeae]|uniref:MarR family transcriptional regulator n=1 Tax=Nonomuraea zeae TaxID=1642303 RepID=A0A5S4GN69_9ACTN|nr:MarR family transcriptional regulator [Nonomuraea zeae]TMR34232.1 MarR family transcriptional regulator [Nonomuraea zeae]